MGITQESCLKLETPQPQNQNQHLTEAPGLWGKHKEWRSRLRVHSLTGGGTRTLAGGCHTAFHFTGWQERQLTRGPTTTQGQECTWLIPTTTPAPVSTSTTTCLSSDHHISSPIPSEGKYSSGPPVPNYKYEQTTL